MKSFEPLFPPVFADDVREYYEGINRSEAIFDPTRNYRYRLTRVWDAYKPVLAFCMLNPSTADAFKNDPTVERCERRAHMWGYGSLIVVNAFAWRSTDPAGLHMPVDPVGPRNYEHILAALKRSQMFICGWGTHGKLYNVGPSLVNKLKRFYPGRAHALRVNADGSPAHPLYLPYSAEPVPL
jgi:hypothetical protein